MQDSNLRPSAPEADALFAELTGHRERSHYICPRAVVKVCSRRSRRLERARRPCVTRPAGPISQGLALVDADVVFFGPGRTLIYPDPAGVTVIRSLAELPALVS